MVTCLHFDRVPVLFLTLSSHGPPRGRKVSTIFRFSTGSSHSFDTPSTPFDPFYLGPVSDKGRPLHLRSSCPCLKLPYPQGLMEPLSAKPPSVPSSGLPSPVSSHTLLSFTSPCTSRESKSLNQDHPFSPPESFCDPLHLVPTLSLNHCPTFPVPDDLFVVPTLVLRTVLGLRLKSLVE